MKLLINSLTVLLLFSCGGRNDISDPDNFTGIEVEEVSECVIDVEMIALQHVLDSVENARQDSVRRSLLLQVEKTYNFDDYRVEVYDGPPAPIDFEGNPYAGDPEYVEFLTQKYKESEHIFAGHYSVIYKGCGAECLHIFLIDRKTGKILWNILSDGLYGYEFRPNSTMMIFNSNLFVAGDFISYHPYWCEPEFYKLENEEFVLLE